MSRNNADALRAANDVLDPEHVGPKKAPPLHPTPTQEIILRALAAGPKSRMDLVTSCEVVRPSNVLTQLSWARQRGWVESLPGPGRSVIYAITDDGTAAIGTGKRTKFVPTVRGGAHQVFEVTVPLDRPVSLSALNAMFEAERVVAERVVVEQAVLRAREASSTMSLVSAVAAELEVTRPRAAKLIGLHGLDR